VDLGFFLVAEPVGALAGFESLSEVQEWNALWGRRM
jgi:hypothetical protein